MAIRCDTAWKAPTGREVGRSSSSGSQRYANGMARLILIRHGESVGNAQQRFTYGPFEPLTAKGRAEALAVAALIRARFDPVPLSARAVLPARDTEKQRV